MSGNSKSEKPVPVEEVYSWASQLSSESRDHNWVTSWYVMPDCVRQVLRQLETVKGGVIGLVGAQGVGKSSALKAIYYKRQFKQDGTVSDSYNKTVLFKWRRKSELLASFVNGTHVPGDPVCLDLGGFSMLDY